MSSSDAQPPLSRRQARERERAAAAGAQPVTPPPTVAAPAEQSEARRRPGSHVAPAPSGPAQDGSTRTGGAAAARPASADAQTPDSTASPASAPAPTSAASPAPTSAAQAPVSAVSASSFPTLPPTSVSEYAPASATEIVPGSGGLTRRQLRQLREAQGQAVQPVPLQDPAPQSSDRTVQDVIGSVDALQVPGAPARPTAADAPVDEQPEREPGAPTLDEAAVAQATEADGSPDAIEPIEEAAAHAEEPRRHRSTWAPHDAATDEVPAVDAGTRPATADAADDDATAAADAIIADGQQPAAARSAAAAATPGVFPLSLAEDDTNEVPVQAPASARSTDSQPADAEAPRVPAAFQRQPEPKPITTVFEPPVGHWSQQAHDSNDAEVHDEETGARRVAVTNTNAIVLPTSALADPTGALNATGEVILTGSIDLPASLSSTGSHRPIDGAEVDRLLEQHDEQPETDASPVRASRAISSHTSTRQVVLAAAKPKESRTPLILGVTVGAVGVAAAAVIIVALVTTHAFGG